MLLNINNLCLTPLTVKGAMWNCYSDQFTILVSIRAPREGGDRRSLQRARRGARFNPRPP